MERKVIKVIHETFQQIRNDLLADPEHYHTAFFYNRKPETETFKKYFGQVEAELDRFNQKEVHKKEDFKELHTKLSVIFQEFFAQPDLLRLDVGYMYGICLIIYSWLTKELAKQNIKFDVNFVFELDYDRKIEIVLFEVKSRFLVDEFVRNGGETARAFFAGIEDFAQVTQEQVEDVCAEITALFKEFVGEVLFVYGHFGLKYGQDSFEFGSFREVFEEVVLFGYDSFLFITEHFGIDTALEQFSIEIDHEVVLEAFHSLKNNDLVEKLYYFREKHTEQEWDATKHLEKIADYFLKQSSDRFEPNRFTLAKEIREQMVEILTDTIYYEFPNGDLNKVVTAFAAFFYLYEEKGDFLGGTIADYNPVLDYQEVYQWLYQDECDPVFSGKFEQYLEYVRKGHADILLMDQAIELFPQFEYPHYYKILYLMYRVHSDQDFIDIQDEQWLSAYTSLAALHDLAPVIKGEKQVQYLPSVHGTMVEGGAGVVYVQNYTMAQVYDMFQKMLRLQTANITQKQDIETLYESLKEQKVKNEKMIRRYSHNWSNLLVPQMIKKVVQTLGNTDFKNEALKLRRAYQNEKLLRQQSVMLQLRHSDHFNHVQNHVRQGIAANHRQNAITAIDVLNESIEIVLFKIFFSDEESRGERESEIIQDFAASGRNISLLTASLEKILLEDDRDMVGWVNKHLLPVNISVEGAWGKLSLLEEKGGAYPLLVELFTELFKNALSYGSKQAGYINFKLDESQVEESAFLTIEVSNPVKAHQKSLGTKEGLSSIEELLKMLNCSFDGKQPMASYSSVSQDEGVYRILLNLKKNLLIEKEEYQW